MQIQFNEVLTPTQFLAQLSFVIGELEELGVKRMPNPRIDFWLGGPNDPYAAALKDAGVDVDALTVVKVQPGAKAGRKPKFHLVHGKRPVASQVPLNGIKYKDLIGRHRDAIDIRGDTKALGNSDDPDVIVPRLLRMTMALLMDLAGVAAGGDDDAIAQVDRPQEVLGGKSYWDATLDDDGFMRIFTLGLFDETVDVLTSKRYAAFHHFPSIWQQPIPGVSQDTKDACLRELGDIFQSRLRAASVIALRPMRFAKLGASGKEGQAGHPPSTGKTLLEALYETDNAAELIQLEIDGYRREWIQKVAGKRPNLWR